MDDYNRSKSYGPNSMQLDTYYPPPPTSRPTASYDLRSYSASYAHTHMPNFDFDNNNSNVRDFKLKKRKSTFASSSSLPWRFADPEFQRKKRVASYRMYSVEGKVKGSLRKSFRWLKGRCTQVLYGWW
ncbi:uncharacterized protein LOC123194363 [Mangifera indica]|uniref:uncharacterized protein LOC123194363 n=1 Tax=Mangifera indica TaxID=29780 RepID=UPI001CFAC2B7|nr:uncharacterized protein LOC123194363 [Mangifera indica]